LQCALSYYAVNCPEKITFKEWISTKDNLRQEMAEISFVSYLFIVLNLEENIIAWNLF
jgi:hypothetical protein